MFPGDPTAQHGKEFLVEKVIIAPGFNVYAKRNQGISEFYADDIALLKLSQKVKMSTHARCLNPDGRVPYRGQCSGEKAPEGMLRMGLTHLRFSPRPICLPCTVEANMALRRSPSSTCKDHGECCRLEVLGGLQPELTEC